MDVQTFLTTIGFVSPASGGQTAVPPPIDAISDLTATADTDSIVLAWTNNETYDDIIIQRSTDGVTFSDLTTIDGAEVGYDDTAVSYDIEYTYRVSGQVDGDLRRNYSNEASDTIVADPSTVANLVGWYRGDSLTPVEGTAISQWDDESGQNNHATQASAGFQPHVLDNEGPNSTLAVQFNNELVPEHLECDGLASYFSGDNQEFTILIVGTFTNTSVPGGEQYTVFHAGNNDPTTANYSFALTEGSTKMFGSHRNDAGTLTFDDSATSETANQFSIWAFRSPGSNNPFLGYKNGGSSELSVSNLGQTTLDVATIGATRTNSVSFGTDSIIAEIIVYNRPITDAELNLVGTYLANKYALTWNSIS